MVPSPRGDALLHVDRAHHGPTPSAVGTAERSGGVLDQPLDKGALSSKVVFLVDPVGCFPGFPLRRTEPYLEWISLFVVPKNKSGRFKFCQNC